MVAQPSSSGVNEEVGESPQSFTMVTGEAPRFRMSTKGSWTSSTRTPSSTLRVTLVAIRVVQLRVTSSPAITSSGTASKLRMLGGAKLTLASAVAVAPAPLVATIR